MSVSVETAARTARRSALFTLIASVERAATGPSDSPVSGSNASAFEPRPVTRMTTPIRLARVEVALLQRFEHGRRPAVAGRPDRRHHLGPIAEAPLRQLGDQLLERLRRRPSRSQGRARARARARRDGAYVISEVGRRAGPEGPARRPCRQFVVPPHSPVATLKFPHDIGARQLAIRSANSGR